MDNAWEQEKLEARKMPENGDESHLSSARFVGQPISAHTSTLLSFFSYPGVVTSISLHAIQEVLRVVMILI